MNKEEKTKRDFFIDNPGAHIDLPKLIRGHVACQIMAIFLEDEQLPHATEEAMAMIDALDRVLKGGVTGFFVAKSGSDVHKAIAENGVSVLLSIEGAEALGDSLDSLDAFYQRGVRAIGITWNRRNAFGRGLKAEGSDGLSSLGKELVEKMQDMRMLVDVSHLSEEGFWDVAEMVRGPFIASHANARAVNDHPRNLTDKQIRAIADHGGAIGCVFVPYFVAVDQNDCSLDALMLHVDHIVAVGGIDSCAMGSDFDGFKPIEAHVIENAGQFHLVYDALRKRGYSHNDAQKILGGNWLRVLDEVLG